MLIFTDAGYKKGVSSHGFIVKHWNGTVVNKKSFSGIEESPIKSEMTSIISAINWVNSLKKLPKRQVRIYTDCLYICEAVQGVADHSIDVTYLKHQLKGLNAKLIWRKRDAEEVEAVHRLAHREMVSMNKQIKINKKKVKYNCEGTAKFKPKKKNTYKNKMVSR